MDGSLNPYLKRPVYDSSIGEATQDITRRGFQANVKNLRNIDDISSRDIPSMHAFPKPGGPNTIVLYEKDGYFTHVPSGSLEATRNPYLTDYPEISLSKEALKGSSRDSLQSVFLVHHDSTLKNILVAWREGGIVQFLEEALKATEGGKTPPAVTTILNATLSLLRWSQSVYRSLSPHKMLPLDMMISTFSTTKDWSSSCIRCIAWHPQCKKIAVGFSDDSVRIYGLQYIVPMLKHRRQKNIGAIAWRYNSSCDVAIGCQGCVLLWRLDPNTVAAKPSSSFLTVINHPASTGPIVSLSWNPKTDQLAFGTCTDSTLAVWDTQSEKEFSVPAAGSGGITQLHWSWDGQKLVSTSPLLPFRIFEFEPILKSAKFCAEAGRVQSIAWSPCNQHMIFADSENPRLFGLSFGKIEGSFRNFATNPLVIADTAEAALQGQSGDEFRVGGLVQSIVWSRNGDRLAVLFKETKCVAIYKVKTKPVLLLEPLHGLWAKFSTYLCLHQRRNTTMDYLLNLLLLICTEAAFCHQSCILNPNVMMDKFSMSISRDLLPS
ncbi:hypothetical protein QYM36_013454 [Artemia franciscana]|uniref:Aladin seven-bladed propeller domain-containing protein n=1 Tax=Artemia franciscana TaxID=6661 RepID=A0AA88HQ66_ARTSF|nr:hypothetical protein QYM36_013454 [Artemia franciscana]